MGIQFACVCGRSLSVGDELAGRQARCPSCGQVVNVPPAAAGGGAPGPGAAPPPPGSPAAPEGAVAAEVRTSRAAIWSLILGLLGFLCLPGLVAVPLGILALVNISNSQGRLKGTGLAIGGLVAALVCGFLVVPAALILPALASAKVSSREASCRNNLKQIGIYLNLYVSRYGSDRDYPPNGIQRGLVSLPNPRDAVSQWPGDRGLYRCEASAPEPDPGADIDTGSSYAETKRHLTEQDRTDTPILWDRKPHATHRRNVLFLDGHVESLTEERFQDLMTKWEKGK